MVVTTAQHLLSPEAMNQTRTFEDLDCWKACRDLRLWLRGSVVAQFPLSEQYRLADQIIRAARSTTANIAEGYGRFHYQDNIRFCRLARGSLFELLDHLITAQDDSLIEPAITGEGRSRIAECIRLLNGYAAWLKRASDSGS